MFTLFFGGLFIGALIWLLIIIAVIVFLVWIISTLSKGIDKNNEERRYRKEEREYCRNNSGKIWK